MSDKQSQPFGINIDMSGIKINAGDQNVNVGWDGVTVNGEKLKMSTSIESTSIVCIGDKCKAYVNDECFNFTCDDKTKIKDGNIYCGNKVVFSKKN